MKLLIITLSINDSVDHYKVGNLNNYKGLERGIDWQGFLKEDHPNAASGWKTNLYLILAQID
jgi:hypothetical protein